MEGLYELLFGMLKNWYAHLVGDPHGRATRIAGIARQACAAGAGIPATRERIGASMCQGRVPF